MPPHVARQQIYDSCCTVYHKHKIIGEDSLILLDILKREDSSQFGGLRSPVRFLAKLPMNLAPRLGAELKLARESRR